MDPVARNPREFLTPKRLDYAIKWRFFRSLMNGNDPDAERVYRWHILKRTNGREPHSSKRTIEDYVSGCRSLLDSLSNSGFDPKWSLKYGTSKLLLGGGAHRLSACLALGIPVYAKQAEREPKATWAADWFRLKKMPQSDFDRMLSDWNSLQG